MTSVCFALSARAAGPPGGDKPVKAVADHALTIPYAGGKVLLPFYASFHGRDAELSRQQPEVTRVLIVIHGLHRNAQTSHEAGLRAVKNAGAAGAGTLLIVPQFLEDVDVHRFQLQGDMLRWAPEAWMAGENALNAPLSTFDVLDSILKDLSSKALFPNLKVVVVAGHSAGGQLAQRYAVVGNGADLLAKSGVRVRYVIANPSSYLYFSPERPISQKGGNEGQLTFAVPEQTCSGKYARWKYGLVNAPAYVREGSGAALEKRYVARDVRYLLGTKDIDPDHPELDKSCSGEAEGPYRLFRGEAYFRYLELRHPELAAPDAAQQAWLVPGVDHDGDRMLNSECGLAALFETGSCSTPLPEPKP